MNTVAPHPLLLSSFFFFFFFSSSSSSLQSSSHSRRPLRRRPRLLVLVVFVAAAAAAAAPAQAQTDAGDMGILMELKKNMKNPELLADWSGEDACGSQWSHIQCQGSSISGIQVANLGLHGPLPATLNQLASLQYLGLQRNNFTGALPTLNGLQNLKTAYLDNNQFDSIPTDFFDNLPALIAIAIDYNQLNVSSTGAGGWSLPPGIAASTQLQNLSLTSVSLTGTIPPFLGTMPSLQVLHLAYNKLSGGIPSSFASSNLRVLQVNNQMNPVLSGPIDVVGSMASLSQIWLQGNKFSGTIPAGLANASSLTDIKLNDNQLVGPIPWELKDLLLTDFTVENNDLNGPIPPIQVPKGSGTFDVTNNHFCQATPGALCSTTVTALLNFLGAVGYPSSIVQSWAGNDPCTGPWMGVTCNGDAVSVLNLANLQLTGTLSPSLASITTLTVIKLNGNNLKGTIPQSLTSLKYLKTLDVSDNQLSGPIPKFANGANVITTGNRLGNGPPPSSPSAEPPSASKTPSATTPVTAPLVPAAPSGSTPAAAAPPPAGSTPYSPPGIAAPSGSTPSSPGFSAPSPPSSASPGAQSNNAPTGDSGSGKGSAPSSNNGTAPVSLHASSLSVATIVAPVLGAVALLLLVPLVVFLLSRKKKKLMHVQSPHTVIIHPCDSTSDPEMVKILVAGQNGSASDTHSRTSSGPNEIQVIEAGNLVISVQVLRNVTNNFSQANILGRGGFGVVYKGELDDGTKIAVKRMEAAVVSSKGLNEFQAEIAVLTKVRHRHLVALLGYCIDGNERLLVYEYMPQGPLSKHLFDWSKQDLKPLDWKTRLTIALDVARGMEYLHGLAHKSFIHRDLKPSNILLGDDYRAKVSDFGLVKLAPDGKNSVETRLAGTFGYLAPEYAVTGRVTTKSDVFSFGVVLMELITGRRALDESQPEESMHLVSWFRRANVSKESFRDAIDSALDITEVESFKSICTVAELAGHCTAREPNQRPDMGHAVSVLAPLVELWKPSDLDADEYGGIDLELTLPQALKKWQAYEDYSSVSSGLDGGGHGLDDTTGSLPTRPTGFAESFTSCDGR